MHVLYVDGVWKAEEGKVPKKKVNQDLRLSNEKGDFIVISRTFFFYPNLVWILNFLFFKENFLIIKQPPPHTSSFVGGGFRLVWGESVHIHTRSINLISGQVFFS